MWGRIRSAYERAAWAGWVTGRAYCAQDDGRAELELRLMSSIYFSEKKQKAGETFRLSASNSRTRSQGDCRAWRRDVGTRRELQQCFESKFDKFHMIQSTTNGTEHSAASLDGDFASRLRGGDVRGEAGLGENGGGSLRLVILNGGLDGVLSEHCTVVSISTR